MKKAYKTQIFATMIQFPSRLKAFLRHPLLLSILITVASLQVYATTANLLLSISNTPCTISTTPQVAECSRQMIDHSGFRYFRNDATYTDQYINSIPGRPCRAPVPESGGYLYINIRAVTPPVDTGQYGAGCTSPVCFVLLPRTE